LRALQEFSSLGSGYSLAFRDLQICGAGELLGAKQSGTMVQIGYELYTQLINEAVAALKNSVDADGAETDSVRDPLEALTPLPAFDVPIIAMLPDSYITEQSQRLFYYQQMMSSRDLTRLGEVQSEVEDRYGKSPKPVSNAFSVMALRIQAKSMGIEKIDARQGRVACNFRSTADIPPRLFTAISKRNKEAFLTREAFIWPYTGDPILAIQGMMEAVRATLEEIEASRALLNL
jgi:transcription-repair coupling factor (superfamily II helicase)